MLDKNDIAQLQNQQRDITKVREQIEFFKKGFPHLPLVKPATAGDGIIKNGKDKIEFYSTQYETSTGDLKILKFVPASGAATRMFKSLFSFLDTYRGTEEDIAALMKDNDFNSVEYLLNHLEDTAFYDELVKVMMKKGLDPDRLREEKNYHTIVEHLITDTGLNYGNLPKGLIRFHKYGRVSRTPVEEHLVEGADYACYKDGKVNIHFTISPEHDEKFRKHVEKMVPCYENHLDVQYYVSFSRQNPSTDTVAVDHDNVPFRNSDGSILFRPAGHGALLDNLNDLDADMIFIKNIDNVVPDRLKDATSLYKKVLGGILLHYQRKIFTYLDLLEKEEILSPSLMDEINSFLEKELCILMPDNNNLDAREYFRKKLNRPIRVCGMVKNEGEPGGGPFWAKNPDGSVSLQIVESAQIDMNDSAQKKIVAGSTHFNPVDLVIGIRDKNGNKFDLKKFVDPMTGFISIKSQEGRELKALELPGLWNGSMSDWNTVFVEVPIETFNPVKIINDLLREEHL